MNPQSTSKSIHCIFYASCQSRPIACREGLLDRQVQSYIYLSFSPCQPTDALTCLCHRKEPLATQQPRCTNSQESVERSYPRSSDTATFSCTPLVSSRSTRFHSVSRKVQRLGPRCERATLTLGAKKRGLI